MCPFCLATAALVAGSAISAGGGLTAFVAHKFRKTKSPDFESYSAKETPHGNRNVGIEAAQNRLAGRVDSGPQGIPR
jgi:hypothetical protein